MSPVDAAVAAGGVAMVLYAVLAGADFGGGVWNLLASGPRADQQRAAVTRAIGPVWEANHVWLIYILVLSFVCFPLAYADVMVGLYVPLSCALIGIVFRGAAFVFRNFSADSPELTRALSATFGIASLLTPFALGDSIGALATGHYAWTSPFALAVGVFAVAVCAQTAAVFLLLEIGDVALRADFRRRAVRSTVVLWLAGYLAMALAIGTIPAYARAHAPLAVAAVVIAVIAGAAVIVCVLTRRNVEARALVVIESAAIFAGWYGTQAPDLVPGRFTFVQAASSDSMIAAFLGATVAGSIVLVPSLLLLFSVFKSARALRVVPHEEGE
jgi:cytochrome bd ubiquinol oxidase subunit II